MIFVKKQFPKGTVLMEEFIFPDKIYIIYNGEVALQHVEWTTEKISKASPHKYIVSDAQNIKHFLTDTKNLKFKSFLLMKKGNIIGEEFLYTSRMDRTDLPTKE